MADAERITRAITPAVTAAGYEVVRVMVSGTRRPVVQVMVERIDRVPMTVDDCASVSRTISPVLDVDDPIAGAYTLEVSSPGVDRPLTRIGDFDRFAGHQARVDLRTPIDGRRRFTGVLRGVADGTLRLEVDGTAVTLPIDEIQRARLIAEL